MELASNGVKGGEKMSFIHELLDMIYPRRCALCSRNLSGLSEIGLCSRCFNVTKNSFTCIIHNPQNSAFFETAYAAFNYDGAIRKCIHSFKYKGRRDLAKPLAGFLIEAARNAPFPEKANLLIPVPLYKSRLTQRGYNQCELLAKEFSHCNGIKLSSGNLIRVKKGEHQVDLTKEERILNVNGLFKLKDNALIKGMDIILLDDIMTTGATMNECARVLVDGGASSVNALVLAMGA